MKNLDLQKLEAYNQILTLPGYIAPQSKQEKKRLAEYLESATAQDPLVILVWRVS